MVDHLIVLLFRMVHVVVIECMNGNACTCTLVGYDKSFAFSLGSGAAAKFVTNDKGCNDVSLE